MANENLRFLVVMAHPHDFTHVAGTCGIHAKMGDSITWVSMTSGRMTHNEKLADELQKPIDQQDKSIVEQSPESYAAEKAAELKDVAAQFGVSQVEILEFTDKPFYDSPDDFDPDKHWWSLRYTMNQEEMDNINDKVEETEINKIPAKIAPIANKQDGINIIKGDSCIEPSLLFLLLYFP